MMHTWAQATDGTCSAVRVVCLDYRKAFDLVDHGILAAKILGLRIPRGIARWVCDFLMDRRQRVKLSQGPKLIFGRQRENCGRQKFPLPFFQIKV